MILSFIFRPHILHCYFDQNPLVAISQRACRSQQAGPSHWEEAEGDDDADRGRAQTRRPVQRTGGGMRSRVVISACVGIIKSCCSRILVYKSVSPLLGGRFVTMVLLRRTNTNTKPSTVVLATVLLRHTNAKASTVVLETVLLRHTNTKASTVVLATPRLPRFEGSRRSAHACVYVTMNRWTRSTPASRPWSVSSTTRRRRFRARTPASASCSAISTTCPNRTRPCSAKSISCAASWGGLFRLSCR